MYAPGNHKRIRTARYTTWRIFLISALGFAILCITNCKEREYDNPYDNLDPAEWAPQDFQITDVSITEKKLTWSYGEYLVDGFKLDRKKGGEGWQVAFQTFTKGTRSWIDIDVVPDGSNYEYRIYAYAGRNTSVKKTASIIATLTAPTDLIITSNTISSVTMTWKDNSYGEEGFIIERNYEGGTWEQIGSTISNYYTDNSFLPNKRVYYRVCAFIGQSKSSYLGIDFDSTIPAPSNLQATIDQFSTITLTWQDNTNGEDGFKIDRKIGNQNWETAYATVAANVTTWQNTSFPINETLFYRLYAFKLANNSAPVEHSITIEIPPPSNFQILPPVYFTSVTLAWQDNSNGEEGFKLDRRINDGSWQVEYAALSANSVSFIDNAVDLENNSYSYKLYTFYGSFNSTPVEATINDHPCGFTYTYDHIAGDVAPVSKTVTYVTVETSLSGSPKCWITQNLGADHPAFSATDATEPSAGWYWQFNRKQGYKHDGMFRTPNTDWISSIDEDSDWQVERDPCTMLLGNDWRLPTFSEWNNSQYSWENYYSAFNSPLKLHAAGCICDVEEGTLYDRGDFGYSRSSSQNNTYNAWTLDFGDGFCAMHGSTDKAIGLSVRCLK